MNLWELADLSTPWSIHVAATLRIADHIAAGKTEIGELAAAAGADRDSLHRVLRHLVSKGVFEQPAPGRFVLNDAAQGFFIPPVRMALDLDNFGGRMAHAWGTMLDAVRTGKPAYHKAFGRDFWEDLNANPKIAAEFDSPRYCLNISRFHLPQLFRQELFQTTRTSRKECFHQNGL